MHTRELLVLRLDWQHSHHTQCNLTRNASLPVPPCCSVKSEQDGQASAGTPITVTAKVRRNQAPIADVALLTRVNYAAEEQIPMTASDSPGGCMRLIVLWVPPKAGLKVWPCELQALRLSWPPTSALNSSFASCKLRISLSQGSGYRHTRQQPKRAYCASKLACRTLPQCARHTC